MQQSMAALAPPVGANAWRLLFAASAALLLLCTHRGNLSRLRAGTEPRTERARVLGRLLSRRGM